MALIVYSDLCMRLQHAARKLDIDVESVLRRAAEGKVKLSIRIPHGYEVWSMHALPCEPARYTAKTEIYEGWLRRDCHVFMLNLSRQDCDHLLTWGEVEQGQFASGYTQDFAPEAVKEASPQLVLEPRPICPPASPRVFVLYNKSYAPPVKGIPLASVLLMNIKIDDLWVSQRDFGLLMVSRRSASAEDLFVPRTYSSIKMVILNRIARSLWATAEAANWVYPSTPDVEARIASAMRAEAPLGAKCIEQAARIIRPVFRAGSAREVDQQTYKTKTFGIMEKVSDRCWGNADLNDSSTYPTNERVVEIILDEFAIESRSQAQAIAQLIRPESAKGGRRKK